MSNAVVYFPSVCGFRPTRSTLWWLFQRYPVLFRNDVLQFSDLGIPEDTQDDDLDKYRIQGVVMNRRLYMLSECKFLRCDPQFIEYCKNYPNQFENLPTIGYSQDGWQIHVDDDGSECIGLHT